MTVTPNWTLLAPDIWLHIFGYLADNEETPYAIIRPHERYNVIEGIVNTRTITKNQIFFELTSLAKTNKLFRSYALSHYRHFDQLHPNIDRDWSIVRSILKQNPQLQPWYAQIRDVGRRRGDPIFDVEERVYECVGELKGSHLRLACSYHAFEPWRTGGELSVTQFSLISDFLTKNEANLSSLCFLNYDMRQTIGPITSLLQGNHTVSEVILQHDCIASSKAVGLANALRTNTAINYLDLSNPNATEKWYTEASADDQAAVRNRQFNQIDDEAARALVLEVLDKPKFTLNLKGNPISPQCQLELRVLMYRAGKKLIL